MSEQSTPSPDAEYVDLTPTIKLKQAYRMAIETLGLHEINETTWPWAFARLRLLEMKHGNIGRNPVEPATVREFIGVTTEWDSQTNEEWLTRIFGPMADELEDEARAWERAQQAAEDATETEGS